MFIEEAVVHASIRQLRLRVDSAGQWQSSPVAAELSTQHVVLITDLAPIYGDDWSCSAAQKPVSQSPVKAEQLCMQLSISQQPICGFDAVLVRRSTRQGPAQTSQPELPAEKQARYSSPNRGSPLDVDMLQAAIQFIL